MNLTDQLKLDRLRILQPEGFGEDVDGEGRPIYTYDGRMISEDQALALYSKLGWWKLLFPLLARRVQLPAPTSKKEKSMYDSTPTDELILFKDPKDKENWITKFIGVYIPNDHLRRFVTLIAPFLYLIRLAIRTPFIFARHGTELPFSQLAVLCKYSIDKINSYLNSPIEQNTILNILSYVGLLALHPLRFIFNLALMLGRGITSINRGPSLASLDMLRFWLEKRDKGYQTVEFDEFLVTSTAAKYDDKYRAPNFFHTVLAALARFTTFASMIAFWCTVLAFVTPLIPVVGPVIAPALGEYLFIEKGFVLFNIAFTAAITKYAIAAAILTGAATCYKSLRSTWNLITNSTLLDMQRQLSDSGFTSVFFKNSLTNCFKTLGITLKNFHEKDSEKKCDLLVNNEVDPLWPIQQPSPSTKDLHVSDDGPSRNSWLRNDT